MRLGGPVFGDTSDPVKWASAVKAHGYGAAYCPVEASATDDVVRAYEKAARDANVMIAEVGAWSNPLGPNSVEAKKALEHCKSQLALAERIGANCCVNISGSRGEPWDGPHPLNLTRETFDMIVEQMRAIIDAVKPKRTFYALETMPWMYPDSTDSYLQLVKAIDRPQFAVHFDPANLLCSPQRFFSNAGVIREFCEQLGRWIKSCHAKDIALATRMTTHLDEVRIGLGGMDYATYLREVDRLGDVPLMLEHLNTAEEYAAAAEHVRAVSREVGVEWR